MSSTFSDILGLELQTTDSEAEVEGLAADIVATDTRTGELVLIENQLENSNHRHLGQILTDIAGLEAKTVIWVAREFHEAHRSAIRWRNEYTADDTAFFAIRRRVVRIGDSPFAPVFEVVEKPNTWERALVKRVNEAEAKLTRMRRDFWSRYLNRHPDIFQSKRTSNVWVPMLPNQSVVLSMYAGSKTSGMFLRLGGPRNVGNVEAAAIAERHDDRGQCGVGAGRYRPGPPWPTELRRWRWRPRPCAA